MTGKSRPYSAEASPDPDDGLRPENAVELDAQTAAASILGTSGSAPGGSGNSGRTAGGLGRGVLSGTPTPPVKQPAKQPSVAPSSTVAKTTPKSTSATQPADPQSGDTNSDTAQDKPRTGSWVGGMLIVSAMTILSRVLGLIRDVAMARLFGLTPVMDAFTVAFRIPNLSRKLFGEGALATSFIPVFTRELQQDDRQPAWILASAVLGWLTLFLAVLVMAGEWALTVWSWQPGVSPETQILIQLTALMLPYLVLICLASQVGAILNSLGQFRWPAAVPVVLNLIWLIGVWWVTPLKLSAEDKARILSLCILVSGFLQLLIQWPSLRAVGFRFYWDWQPVRPQVREILRTMFPVVLGLSITQINTFTDSIIAWTFSHPPGEPDALMALPGAPRYPLAAGAVSALYYGERMYQFPLGVFGVALGTAIFPMLARHAARGEMDQLREDLTLGLRLVLVIGVPASAALMWLALPIARCLFERGSFTPDDTLRTARIIAAYGSGVWAYCGLLILQRGCYAVGDRTTPLKLGMIAVALNLVMNMVLIWQVAERGLALSTSLCAMLQVVGIIWIMQQKVGPLNWAALKRTGWRTLVATGLMTAAGYGLIYWTQQDPRLDGKLLGLLVPCLGASLVYLLAAWALRLEELWIVLKRGR